MSASSSRWSFMGRVLIATLAFAALALVVAHNLVPGAAWWTVLLSVAGGAFVVLGILAALVVAMGAQNQFTLKHGGTDGQWMWWGGEPPGLQRERHAAEAQRKSEQDAQARVGGSDAP